MDKEKRSAIIRAAAADVANNYRACEIPMYGDALRLPSREAIIEIIRDFQKLLFPVYYGDRDLLKLPPEQYSALLMEHIYDKLTRQIALTMEEGPESEQRACEICDELIACLPSIQSTLMKDLFANFDGDPAAYSMEEVILSYPGFFAIFIYRIAHELYVRKVAMIPRIMTEFAHSQTGIDINPGATIGDYFFIDHGTGIVVGETSIIGDHVKLYQGATLGALSPAGMRSVPGERRHPKVGNNVTIYAGSTLLGGATEIGDNVVIGGNAFLTSSVEADTTVSIKKPEMTFRGKHNPNHLVGK
ncbi:MAG: serine acetyltransferase [Oscillospiraceae bacterium]|nr:serine acetyltransferase [Oscillospiraceae bacterium]